MVLWPLVLVMCPWLCPNFCRTSDHWPFPSSIGCVWDPFKSCLLRALSTGSSQVQSLLQEKLAMRGLAGWGAGPALGCQRIWASGTSSF
ncbi:hypothetical protein XELAEV_18003171mg [Xenopus laevis]|nr:hypothetical protein XELAEV_18003171mg [Xenopus laevis]